MSFTDAVKCRDAARARALLDETDDDDDDDDATAGGFHLLRPFLAGNDVAALEWLGGQGVVRADDPRWLESDVGVKLLTAAATADANPAGDAGSLRWFLRAIGPGFVDDLLPWQKRAIRREASDAALRLLYEHGFS